MANVISDSQYQEKAQSFFNELNLPEQQIRDFFTTGILRIPQVTRHSVCNIINELIIDNINSDKDIELFKKLFPLIMMLNWGDLEELYANLDEYLDTSAQ